MKKTTEGLLNFIATCTSPYHTVATSQKFLAENGFEELKPADSWHLAAGGKYFTKVYDSTLLAFRVGAKDSTGLKIAAAHTDFPCFRIKPQAGILTEGYGTLNVEGYGGMIVSTWLDRPLSMAGKIVLKGKDPFAPKVRLVDFKRPLLSMPNLAIHMNRAVNDGYKWNKQKDVLPLAAMFDRKSKEKDFFVKFLAKELKCKPEDILSYELSTYPVETGCTFGLDDEFISSPRLDNITSVRACLDGIVASKAKNGLQIAAIFDNEEVGSKTKQGAGSNVLIQLIERIYDLLGKNKEEILREMASGFMLSVDVAHALHPNYTDKCDPTNKPIMNSGLVLKQAATQSYAGDAEAVGVIAGLCEAKGIPFQTFVNRSDLVGGSTLGSIASAIVPIRTMDIGVPMLAMHSARETMGEKDQEALSNLLCAFFAK
jgi:aspartyl aminopeptidase